MSLLIKNAVVYAPDLLGKCDVLIIQDKIAAIEAEIEEKAAAKCLQSLEVIDASGKTIVPGFIDQHVHLIGGGGEAGFASRTPEIQLSKIIKAGVTTVAGVLGTDGFTRNIEALFAKASALEHEGITSYIYTGSYKTPSVTLTGSVARDIMFIDKVLGVKMALADHRSSHFSFEELSRLASDVRLAGMLSGKPGLIHIHMGAGKNGLDLVMEVLAKTDLPINHFIPTHVTRTSELFAQAKDFARLGGRIDITSFGELNTEECSRPSKRIMECLKEAVPAKNITVSSDGNGSVPRYDKEGNIIGIGVGEINTSYLMFKNLVQKEGLAINTALTFFTANVADVLRIYPQKGCIQTGSDADILLLDEDLTLNTVYAKGKKMMAEGVVIAKGTFE